MTIYKNEKGLWSIRIRYKTPDNKWITIKRFGGKLGFKTKSQALNQEREIIHQLENKYSMIQLSTLKEVLDIMLSDPSAFKKESTLKTTKDSLKHLKRFYDIPISNITYLNLREVLSSMNQINKKTKEYEYSLNTISKFYYNTRKLFNYALYNDYISNNPMEKVNMPSRIEKGYTINDISKQTDYWTYSQYKIFINSVDDQLYKTIFNTLYYAGCRRGECLALTWNDVDLVNKTINITKTLDPTTTVKKSLLTSPKTKHSIRRINIPNILCDELSKWKQIQSTMYGFNDSKFVFGFDHSIAKNTLGAKFRSFLKFGSTGIGWTSKEALNGKLEVGSTVYVDGKVYYRQDKSGGGYKSIKTMVTIVKIIDATNNCNYGIKIALPYITLHKLRHSSVSFAINNLKDKENLFVLARHFGHSVEQMDKTYGHLFTNSEVRLVENLNKLYEKEERK